MSELPTLKAFGSPERGPQTLFKALRFLANQEFDADRTDETEAIGALSIITAIASLEAFINTYFRLIAEERNLQPLRHIVGGKYREKILKKIQACCSMAFGRRANFCNDMISALNDLEERRHKIVHFRSTHENLDAKKFHQLGSITISGAASFDMFVGISGRTPADVLTLVEDILVRIALCRGHSLDQQCLFLERWTDVWRDEWRERLVAAVAE